MTDEHDVLREQLAALAHAQWSGWMTYMVSRCVRVPSDGCLIIPAAWMERWQRQIDTPYADLPEHEKESDRAEADRVLALLPPPQSARTGEGTLISPLVDEYADCLAQRGAWKPWTFEDTTGWRCRADVERATSVGAREALLHVAERLGVTDLHEQATDVVARGEEG